MQCELCGKIDKTFPVLIEGVELNVCSMCAKHGKILKKPVIAKKKEKIVAEEQEEEIVKNYAELIKKKREEMNLTQEEFAKKLNERLSVMQNIENGSLKPSIEMARKFERVLGLKLIEQIKTQKISFGKMSSEKLTIGDILRKTS